MAENKMQDIKVSKVTLNIGAGINQDDVKKAELLLQKISGMKTIQTVATKRIPTWKVRPGLPLGVKVTLRGKKAMDVLKNVLEAVNNQIPETSFNVNGFSFGVKEYIDIPGLKYDPDIGIIGFDVCVSLERAGFHVKRRKIKPSTIGKNQKISKEDSRKFATEKLGISFREKETMFI